MSTYFQQITQKLEADPQKLLERLNENPSLMRLMHSVLGMASELGEIADIVKRTLVYGAPLDVEHLKEELGDLKHYWANGCNAVGLDELEVTSGNLAKMRLRFPEGVFTEADAIRRRDKEGVEL